MRLKSLIEVLAKIWLHTQRLQQENTHPDHPLLRSIEFVLNSIEEDQDEEIMRSASVDDE